MRTPDRVPSSRVGHRLLPAILVLLLVVAAPARAKQAQASFNVSVTVLSSCAASTDHRVVTTCSDSRTPPTVEQREQGTVSGQIQLTVVTF